MRNREKLNFVISSLKKHAFPIRPEIKENADEIENMLLAISFDIAVSGPVERGG
jgi:hypothetical protein